VIISITLFFSSPRSMAGVGEWKSYTDMKNVVGIVPANNSIWAATGGGLFRLSLADSSFRTFTNSEGLTSNNLTAVTVDASGKIWVGAATGAIDIYDPVLQQWQYVQDILFSNIPRKGITNFLSLRDSVYIASEFGLSLFVESRFEFRETYSKFGSFPSSIRVNSVALAGGKLWVATPSGAASADISNVNLSSPSAWTTYTSANGLPSNSVNAVASFNGTIYAATDNGLAKFTQSSWEIVPNLSGRQIILLTTAGGQLYLATPQEVYSLAANGAITQVGPSLPATITALSSDASGGVAVGVGRNGIAFPQGSTWRYRFPNGPASNSFIGLRVDSAGVLHAASSSNQGSGFYSFDLSAPVGKQWTNYSVSTNPELKTNDYYKVSLGLANSKWFSSWGRGVARLNQNRNIAVFANFVGIPADTNFIVIGDVVPDRRGNTWMTVYWAANGNAIAVYRPDSTFFFLRNGFNPAVTRLPSMAIDLFDTKWFVSDDPSFKGLIYMTDGGTLTNLSDDTWNSLTDADGLSSNTITKVVVDRDGLVWVGTDLGLNTILNPKSPKGAIRRLFIAREQYINDIAIDPLGNKWVGTREGVFVLSPDGTSLLAQYSVLNTGGKLVDNDVRAVTFDGARGIAYFGTEKGLSSLTTSAVAPVESFTDLTIYPNPFKLPSGRLLQIDGLVRNSGIKILAIDGRVVREFFSPGGRIAFWDGRDERGVYVPSGVYLIVAFSESGDEVSKGKVAVLRE
jgi:ligand-binding sensor domain-containing protein